MMEKRFTNGELQIFLKSTSNITNQEVMMSFNIFNIMYELNSYSFNYVIFSQAANIDIGSFPNDNLSEDGTCQSHDNSTI